MNIYLNNETDFIHNGLGFLTDVLNASISDNLNGDYSLYFEYKINGQLSEYLKNENIVKCKVADGTKQLFIIKNVNKTFDSIQVSCKHIFYLLLDNFVEDTAPTNLSCQPFLKWVLDKTNFSTQFQVFSDITTPKSARYVRKNPVEIILGDESNSVVNLFGGELKRDNFSIYINKQIGSDNGVKLIVGKNITGINITIDTSTVYTRIMPQGFDGLFLPEKYIDSPLINNYINPKIYKVEFSDIKYDLEDESAYHDIEEAYSALRNATNELFESGIDKPIINVKVDWIELSKTNEYKNYSNLEKVMLGDIITIDLLGLSYKTKVIKTIYNPLTDRIESFEIGTAKANIGTSTNTIQKQVESINPNSILESAKQNATQLITQAMGGYIYKTQNELFIMDTDNPNTATKVWRWNMNGLGYSKNGIDGPYATAMTSDGQIVADFVTTGKLNTNVIEGYDQVVISVESQDEKISQMTQTVDELNSKIKDIADITITGESNFATVNLDNINQSEPITIKIRPVGENISYDYPHNDYPQNDYSKVRTIRFTNKTTSEIFDYVLPDDLLYYDSENYDEFILEYDSQTVFINKKVSYNADGTTYVLETPTINEYKFPKIELTDGNYNVTLLGYDNAYLFVRLMAQNIYTTQFATRAEVSSEINQTATDINMQVSKKVGKEEVIASINLTSENATIQANKVNISGVISAINNNTTTTIDGDKITSGSITANQIAANTISANKVASDVITTNNFSAQEINADKITSGTISSKRLSSDVITSTNFSSQNINADKITSGTISTDRLESKVITTDNFSAQKINANNITSGTISTSRLSTDVITTSNFSAQEINANKITSGTLSADKVSGGTISSSDINVGNSNYYLRMGTKWTKNPEVSGLNVGSNGVNINGLGLNNNGTHIEVASGVQTYELYATGRVRTNYVNANSSINLLAGGSSGTASNGGILLRTGNGHITLDASNGGGNVYAEGVGVSNSKVLTNNGAASSQNTKENIVKFDDEKYDKALELLKGIDLYNYDYKYDLYKKRNQYGFIIDEIEQLDNYEEFFDFTKEKAKVDGEHLDFAVNENDKNLIEVKQYDSNVLDKYLLTCLKAMQNKIETLENKIKELESEK